MNKIETFDEYRQTVKDFKASVGKTTSNCFFMPNEVKALIASGKLYYTRMDTTLYIWVIEKDYDHLYYYLAADKEPGEIESHRQVVLDFVCREGKEDSVKQEAGVFENIGFSKYKTYVRMKRTVNESEPDLDDVPYTFGNNNAVYAAQIVKLWSDSLDMLSIPIPSVDEVEELISEKCVYYMLDGDTVVAAVHMECTGRSCILNHISVDDRYRGKGLGKHLMLRSFEAVAANGVQNCNLWVDVNNIPALNMYKKYGFQDEGMLSEQYLK